MPDDTTPPATAEGSYEWWRTEVAARDAEVERLRAELAEVRQANDFVGDQCDRFREEIAELHRALVAELSCAEKAEAERDALKAEADDERAAKKIAADAADRFRDVLSDALGHPDENPGDDVLIAELRTHFGRTGPEPTRWREFIAGAQAIVDQINDAALDAPETPGDADG